MMQKILIGSLIIVTVVAAIFIYLYTSQRQTTVTYDPLSNPTVQNLIQKYEIEKTRLEEKNRNDSLRLIGMEAFTLQALRSVTMSERQVQVYYNQITAYKERIDAIKTEAELESEINRIYREAHK